MTAEFSRPIRTDTVGAAAKHLDIEATLAEREALARRFVIPAVDSLTAEVEVTRNGEMLSARGSLKAAVTQSCVATDEPVEQQVSESFEILFRPHPAEVGADEEIELSAGELDVVFYDGVTIDVGEAVAESLALALDPYPRSPAAEAALREAGVKTEEEARMESSPFAVLKDKLGK
ncbi:MAG: DUF177 domain-containing protein [Alphaproteobacteria bacterium]|nr:MAG: DUF177 domain-containing protein [Alphaproteobacteria bacterium]